jgi:hypothetical protein
MMLDFLFETLIGALLLVALAAALLFAWGIVALGIALFHMLVWLCA